VQFVANVLFWCSIAAFIACCVWALSCWVQALGVIRQYGPWPSDQSVFRLSTAENASHPAYPHMRRFMLALACGIFSWLLGMGLGLGFGILH